jgi:hypothetical protein
MRTVYLKSSRAEKPPRVQCCAMAGARGRRSALPATGPHTGTTIVVSTTVERHPHCHCSTSIHPLPLHREHHHTHQQQQQQQHLRNHSYTTYTVLCSVQERIWTHPNMWSMSIIYARTFSCKSSVDIISRLQVSKDLK